MPKASRRNVRNPRPRRAPARPRPVRPRRSAPRSRRFRLPPGSLGAFGGALGTLAGTALGGPAGGPVGASIGSGIGHAFGNITGLGDYQVSQNVFAPGAIVNPSRHPNAVVIRHREYLFDLISSPTANTFLSQVISLNPGVFQTFPFLSQVASNFEEYAFEGLVVEFISTSGTAVGSNNTALGTVVIASKYNAYGTFQSKADMESSMFCHSSPPCNSILHFIECDPSQSVHDTLYVRSNAVPAGQDARLFDLAETTIATTGMQGTNVNLGEIWIRYQVALLKPRLFASLGNMSQFYHMVSDTYNNNNPLGNPPDGPTANSTLSVPVDTTSTVFTFPESPFISIYEILMYWFGTAANVVAPTATYSAGVTVLSLPGGASSAAYSPNGGTNNSAGLMYRAFVQVPPSSPSSHYTLTMGVGGTLPTAGTQMDFWCIDMPYNTVSQ